MRQSTWQDGGMHNLTVQGGMREGQHASSIFTLLGAGPPHLTDIGSGGGLKDSVYPIGLSQDFGIGQNKGTTRLYEIGSKRSYVVFGHSAGQLSLSEVYYNGPNLLRKLFAVWPDADGQQLMATTSHTADTNPKYSEAPYGGVAIVPGFNNFLHNLGSDFFDRCFGLYLQVMDNLGNTLIKTYFEEAVIPSYNIGFGANSVLLQESAAVDYERSVPVWGKDYAPLLKGILDTPF